jgi:hypothetical protein
MKSKKYLKNKKKDKEDMVETFFHSDDLIGPSRKCYICGEDLVHISSHFDMDFHYKVGYCQHGHKTFIKVDFDGSGHDSISVDTSIKEIELEDEVIVRTLENLVKKAEKSKPKN